MRASFNSFNSGNHEMLRVSILLIEDRPQSLLFKLSNGIQRWEYREDVHVQNEYIARTDQLTL